jgi:hypothetical protein
MYTPYANAFNARMHAAHYVRAVNGGLFSGTFAQYMLWITQHVLKQP